MTSALSSFGSLVKIGDGGSPESFATIAELLDIKGPKIKANTEDATNQSSTDGWEEDIVTTLSAGEVEFEIQFIPTAVTQGYANGLLKDAVNRTKRNFKIVFPDTGATTWAFAAFVIGFEPEMPVKGKLKASVTLKVQGKPTLV